LTRRATALLAVWLIAGIVATVVFASYTVRRFGPFLVSHAIQRTSTAPASLPSDFPYYPGAHAAGSVTSIPGQNSFVFTASDPPDDVFDFYKSALKKPPYEVVASLPAPLRSISCRHTSPRFTCSLSVEAGRAGGTIASFAWSTVPI
jgi:hypothetical protein